MLVIMRKELKRPNLQSTTCNGRIQAMRFAIRELVDGQAPEGTRDDKFGVFIIKEMN